MTLPATAHGYLRVILKHGADVGLPTAGHQFSIVVCSVNSLPAGQQPGLESDLGLGAAARAEVDNGH